MHEVWAELGSAPISHLALHVLLVFDQRHLVRRMVFHNQQSAPLVAAAPLPLVVLSIMTCVALSICRFDPFCHCAMQAGPTCCILICPGFSTHVLGTCHGRLTSRVFLHSTSFSHCTTQRQDRSRFAKWRCVCSLALARWLRPAPIIIKTHPANPPSNGW